LFTKKHPLAIENLGLSNLADFFLDNKNILKKFTFNKISQPSLDNSLWKSDYCPKSYDIITSALFGPGLLPYLCIELFCFYHFPHVRLKFDPKKEILDQMSRSDSSFEMLYDHFFAVAAAPKNPVLLAVILAFRQLEIEEVKILQEKKIDFETAYPMGVFLSSNRRQVFKIAESFFDIPDNERHRSILLIAFEQEYIVYTNYLLNFIKELKNDEQRREIDAEVEKELATEALAQQELSQGTDPYDYEPGDPESPFKPAEGKTTYPPRLDPRTWNF